MNEPTIAVETRAAEPPDRPGTGVPDELPILPLRETVLFPQAVLPLAVARTASVRRWTRPSSGRGWSGS
jgi:hypothetical protein